MAGDGPRFGAAGGPDRHGGVRERDRNSGVASAELTEAWIRAYGRDPDPSDAWDHAIKAVEAILIPIVVSKAGQAAVGSRDRCTRSTRPPLAARSAWRRRRPEPCAARRHASPDVAQPQPRPPRRVAGAPPGTTIEEARSVVHLAVKSSA